jgi:3-oxoacyl-[acyl-carrier protein] reductase
MEASVQLARKVAIVTGACSGLGRAIALRFAEAGACVVVADINEAAIGPLVDELTALAGDALGYPVDLCLRGRVQAMADWVVDRKGRIDILVTSAGITRFGSFETLMEDDWDRVLELDLKAVFFSVQAVAPQMIRQRYGRIVTISSTHGLGASQDDPAWSPGGSSAYASAKAAVIQLTKNLAGELGPSGVTVNCVAPGFFLTTIQSATRTPEQIEELIRRREKAAALRRTGQPRELAETVLFFASDQSSFITGQTLSVDGGRTDKM